MADRSNYTWDFDRPSAGFLQPYSTFSVGVFQWMPKASGNGIKKSKAIARVLGYCDEPERVYAKANSLCARLNRERATAVAPPDWLQKQYSIPRPAGMVVERTSTDFTAAQVRSMRLQVMKERLLPEGFVVGKDATYVRRQNDQIHLINFQGSRYGHEFTVNLGFHYSFVPPLVHHRRLPLNHFDLLDCILRERIGQFIAAGNDRWFEYGQDRDALVAKLALCATTCLAVFQECAERWKDSSAFFRDMTGSNKSKWGAEANDLAIACVALRTGRFGEVETRLHAWSDDRFLEPPALHVWLSSKLGEFRDCASSKTHVTLPDWVE